MTTSALQPEVRRLFEELTELTPRERHARLAREEPALAERVERLFAASEAAPEFLERPALESELVGHAAGPWVLEERLSSGGAGDVYRARRADGSPGWRVALKVLRRGDAELVRRFEAERRSLAALNHPFIVPLVDAGVLADGRPFLATRLVEGLPLDAHCAGLELDARLRLFLDVCAAVRHAHERLIAHCDLKPANILVTREGMPQLLDFGVARLFSEGAGAHELGLTPGYASPEQLAGEPLGAASDVWSLGVILYELATGRRPFAGAPRAAPLPPSAAVRAADRPAACAPPRDDAARLEARMRGDFDALVGRALAQDRRARYGSIELFARDLEHFLGARPLEARPASRLHRARLFARRNRMGTVAALMAFVALAVGASALARDLARSRAEASAGWRAHAQAALAARMLEDLARAAGPGLERALDEASARLRAESELGPEAEGRLCIALGALYLDAGRPIDAAEHLRHAQDLASRTRGFGREDLQRIETLLARCDAQLQGNQPARSTNQ
jgi:serine/threonine-protein kinase